RNENNPAWVLFINPGTKYIALSRPVCAGGKTAIRRCSHSTASIDNAAHRRRQGGLSYQYQLVRCLKQDVYRCCCF
ncbi:hypothetical protein, partial [Thiolapillus sp.]|uniref:hypothetical protein n=1 Tax=Thiolapillus sp. TaxID=2017437 RepID=UPI003AF5CB19